MALVALVALVALLTVLLTMREKYRAICRYAVPNGFSGWHSASPYSHIKSATMPACHVCTERVGMTVKPNRVRIDPNDILKCQECDLTNLHHESVEIFEREEDALSGVHVLVERTGVVVNDDMTGNPSDRRHGLLIRFTCETCDATPILKMIQHKGSTYMEWM
jgi:hypothetical protein